MLRLTFCVVLVAFITTLAPPVKAQAVTTQIPVVTRLVQLYSEYEQRLADAVNRKDTDEIEQLVAADFELRSASNIGVPVPRADWLAQSLKERPATISIGQMAVHDYGTIRIVSFVMKREEATRRELSIAVVDVWLQSGENSVLKVRYAAVQTAQSLRVPGEVRQPQVDKRY